jgi:hypothetical protein
MAGYWKDDLKGDDRWTIRIPEGKPAEPTPEQREASARTPEVSADALAAYLGQFPSADELDEFLKDFPKPPEPGDPGPQSEQQR